MSFKLNQGLFKLNITDHYAVLGISLRASTKEIRKRYLKVAQKLHPDTCKSKSDEEKNLSNQLLSKLVNPAYEILSKDKSQTEYLLIISNVGDRLAREGGKVSITFKSSKTLLEAQQNIDLVYEKLLAALSVKQYQSLDNIFKRIEQISELNLIYSIIQASGQIKKQKEKQKELAKQNLEGSETLIQTSSPASHNINRAKQYMNSNNYIQAVSELREALKIEPENSTIYGLLGLAYVKQGQLSMAKVYVKKASDLNPQDPVAIQSKQELNQTIGDSQNTNTSKSSDRSGGGGIFSGFFGGKKK